MQITKRKKVAAAIGGGAIVVASAGTAFAFFTSSGNGTGSATTGSATAWTVASQTATGGPMQPGVATTDETVPFTVTNAGSGYENLNQVIISVATSTGAAWMPAKNPTYSTEGACSSADYALGGQTASGSYTLTLPSEDLAPGAAYTGSVTVHMLDTGVAQDNCQGITVPLYFAAS